MRTYRTSMTAVQASCTDVNFVVSGTALAARQNPELSRPKS